MENFYVYMLEHYLSINTLKLITVMIVIVYTISLFLNRVIKITEYTKILNSLLRAPVIASFNFCKKMLKVETPAQNTESLVANMTSYAYGIVFFSLCALTILIYLLLMPISAGKLGISNPKIILLFTAASFLIFALNWYGSQIKAFSTALNRDWLVATRKQQCIFTATFLALCALTVFYSYISIGVIA